MTSRLIVSIALLCRLHAAHAAEQSSFHFNFGPGPATPGVTVVAAETTYSRERGFGGEPTLALANTAPTRARARARVKCRRPRAGDDAAQPG